ncbi:hypothetical protein K435DRAFT_863057 [Dendrothele bispora CBS 962.96]|uniref:Uncharacterized protein n=1 Tax=Dendrothele bispora (strain CBS 962.96) TaxID=1314807 RepID=A0A4V4HER5_DENBC|nr:hypothetical protein K435DRAFT_863057 [Dendrothele bispora CBS 962.96]
MFTPEDRIIKGTSWLDLGASDIAQALHSSTKSSVPVEFQVFVDFWANDGDVNNNELPRVREKGIIHPSRMKLEKLPSRDVSFVEVDTSVPPHNPLSILSLPAPSHPSSKRSTKCVSFVSFATSTSTSPDHAQNPVTLSSQTTDPKPESQALESTVAISPTSPIPVITSPPLPVSPPKASPANDEDSSAAKSERFSSISIATSMSMYSQASAPSTEGAPPLPPLPNPPLPNVTSPKAVSMNSKPFRDSLQVPKMHSRPSSVNYLISHPDFEDKRASKRLSFISVATTASMYSQPSELHSLYPGQSSIWGMVQNRSPSSTDEKDPPPSPVPQYATPMTSGPSRFVLAPAPKSKPRSRTTSSNLPSPNTIAISTTTIPPPAFLASCRPNQYPLTKRNSTMTPLEDVQTLSSAFSSSRRSFATRTGGRGASMVLYHVMDFDGSTTTTPLSSTLYGTPNTNRSILTSASGVTARTIHPARQSLVPIAVVDTIDSRYSAVVVDNMAKKHPRSRSTLSGVPLVPYAYDPAEGGGGMDDDEDEDEDDWLHDPFIPSLLASSNPVTKRQQSHYHYSRSGKSSGTLGATKAHRRSGTRGARGEYNNGINCFTWNWLLDVVVMLVVVIGVLSFFLVYPLVLHFERKSNGAEGVI